MDDDNDRRINFQEFSKAAQDFRLDFLPEETRQLFELAEIGRDNRISVDEFAKLFIGEMNPFRKNLTIMCFHAIDKFNQGTVTMNQIKQRFTSRRHPSVVSGQMTQDEVLCDFVESFEIHHLLMESRKRDHHVTVGEFVKYYNNISVTIDSDQEFDKMMRNSWRLPTDDQLNIPPPCKKIKFLDEFSKKIQNDDFRLE